jgi:hypothetical protein
MIQVCAMQEELRRGAMVILRRIDELIRPCLMDISMSKAIIPSSGMPAFWLP